MSDNARRFPITVTPRPDGADLDVEGFQRQTVLDVIQALAEHPELMDDLDRVLSATPANPFHPERHLPTEHLVNSLSALLPTSIRVYGPALDQLAGTLTAISRQQGGRPIGAIPTQREGEAA